MYNRFHHRTQQDTGFGHTLQMLFFRSDLMHVRAMHRQTQRIGIDKEGVQDSILGFYLWK